LALTWPAAIFHELEQRDLIQPFGKAQARLKGGQGSMPQEAALLRINAPRLLLGSGVFRPGPARGLIRAIA